MSWEGQYAPRFYQRLNMAIPQLAIAAVGLGLNLFGASQEKQNADAIIKAQYEQAKRQWKFQTNDRNDLYEYRAATDAARANNETKLLIVKP